MTCRSIFSEKNTKNTISLSSTEIAQRVVGLLSSHKISKLTVTSLADGVFNSSSFSISRLKAGNSFLNSVYISSSSFVNFRYFASTDLISCK